MYEDLDRSRQVLHDKGLLAPIIHLNGTSGGDLFRQYVDAVVAIRAAIEAIPCPHGRDYYILPANAHKTAMLQMERQRASLQVVLEEVSAVVENLSAQQELRKMR